MSYESKNEEMISDINNLFVKVHIKLFYNKKSYHVTDKYTPNGALFKIAQNM